MEGKYVVDLNKQVQYSKANNYKQRSIKREIKEKMKDYKIVRRGRNVNEEADTFLKARPFEELLDNKKVNFRD